jgi:uncharacterized phage protein gp47/JayE
MTFPSFQNIYDAIRAEIQSRNPNLTDFSAGSVLDAYAGGMAIGADAVMRYAASRFDALFLSRATGADLDTIVLDRINLPRLGASISTARINIMRDGSYPTGAITIPAGHPITVTRTDGSVVNATTTSAINIPSGAGPWMLVAGIASTTPGRDRNTDSTATYVLTTTTGTSLPTVGSIIITSSGLAGGADVEDDASYRARAIEFYGSLTRGTGPSLVVASKQNPQIRYAAYREVINGPYVDTYLYIADSDGNSNSQMEIDVFDAITEWRAMGRAVIVEGAAVEYIPMHITIKIRAGVSTGLIDQAVRVNVISAVNSLSPSEVLYLSGVETVVHQTSPAVLAADVVVNSDPSIRQISGITPNRILRVRDQDITTTITSV